MTTTTPLTDEQLTAIRARLGDTQPASNRLLTDLAESVRDRREHEHPTWEDLFCSNLAGWAGERVRFVLRRLVDAEAEAGRLRAELARRRTEDLNLRGTLAPADAPRRVPMPLGDSLVPAVEWLIAELAKYVGHEPTIVEEMAELSRRLCAVDALLPDDPAEDINAPWIPARRIRAALDGETATGPTT